MSESAPSEHESLPDVPMAASGVRSCPGWRGSPDLATVALAWPAGREAGRMARVLSYSDFFLGSAGVAGALTGLLFVALSVTRGELTGKQASVEQQSIAATSFTALVDALWISLFALRPGNDIPTASLVLGLIGLTSTAGLTVRLWRARRREQLSNRWPVLLLVITVLYGYQISTAFTAGSSLVAQSDAATLVFIFFGVGLARAWELLGLRGGGLLDLLATRGGGDRPQGGARAGPAEASGRESGTGP